MERGGDGAALCPFERLVSIKGKTLSRELDPPSTQCIQMWYDFALSSSGPLLPSYLFFPGL